MFIMHLLIPCEAGPVVSGTGPDMPGEIVGREGIGRTFGPGGTYVIACDPGLKMDGDVHRATHVHPPSVSCRKCRDTEIFKALLVAHKAGQLPNDEAVAELPGCC